MASKVIAARSRYGVAVRIGTVEDQESARRDLAAAKLEQFVERVVTSAPPLTAEQRARIAALLRPTGGVSA